LAHSVGVNARRISPIVTQMVSAERAAALRKAVNVSAPVQVFGRRHNDLFHALWRPASKKRQGTKSREVGHRRGSGRYGDLMAAPNSVVDVTPTGRGRGICTQARLEAYNRHLGKRSERINERTVRRAQ
jgi:hypothetical protein